MQHGFYATYRMDEMLLYTEDSQRAIAEIQSIGGRVTIELGDNVLIANIPSNIATKQDAFAHSSTKFPATASKMAHSHAKAYEMYLKDIQGPQLPVTKYTEENAPKAYPQLSPYSANSHITPTLRGKIAVGQFTVSGPGSLAISAAEESKISGEVLRGLKFWTDNAPADADLSFKVYGSLTTINAADAPAGCNPCHDTYVVPALKARGFASNEDLAKALKRDTPNAVGAFLAYFTKYRQHHFAYAYNGGPTYMQYSNGAWGSDNIDRVFAHETGHVFNAPDEYTSCNCNQDYGGGTCTAKNANCEETGSTSCTTAQETCVMDSTDIEHICEYSIKHVGWC